MYDFKTSFRAELQKLLDPYIRQAADDRGYFIALEKQMLVQREQISDLEDILFDR